MTQSMSQTQSPKPLESRLSSIDSCIFQLRTWKPFNPNNNSSSPSSSLHNKRPCLSDRKTSSFSIDISKLSLLDDDPTTTISTSSKPFRTATSYRLIARKRRRRPGGSRSVSGRSSDRSGTRRCCSVGASAAHGTCSDFPVAMGTDSSGELFGEANWASDVSEARRERDNGGGGGGGSGGGGSGEKEGGGGGGLGFGGVSGVVGCSDGNGNGNESGYGSEPGYRGDAEFGYGDEFDEEEDDPRLRLLFWGEQIGAVDSKMEMVGENTLLDQKSHHRCRRRKHDCRMVDALSFHNTHKKSNYCTLDETTSYE